MGCELLHAQYNDEYLKERISAKECFVKECAACGEVDRERLDAFIDEQRIDPTFPAFVDFCRSRGLQVVILSDGLDYYIRRILQSSGLGDIPFYSNALKLEAVDEGSKVRMVPSFPYDDAECARCACCKRNIMVTRAGDEDVIVYIGDGYSDQCPAQYADVVFAKRRLQRYCQEENISYHAFQSFGDVQVKLEQILSHKRVRKRLAAERKRQELFMAG